MHNNSCFSNSDMVKNLENGGDKFRKILEEALRVANEEKDNTPVVVPEIEEEIAEDFSDEKEEPKKKATKNSTFPIVLLHRIKP